MFVAELNGKIFSLPADRNSSAADLFLDVKDLVDGLNQNRDDSDTVKKDIVKKGRFSLRAVYGLTFHPQFAENRYCYICYSVTHDSEERLANGSRVVRLKVTDSDPPKCIPESETEIITWLEGGHNGGCLKFGPDGCLYISTGDGSTVFPPDEHSAGQDVSNLLSSILRIDVDRNDVEGQQEHLAYAIPDDNPFVGMKNARGEVWAYGLRNPWKFSFDRQSGDLWVGDVGWELWELIYRARKGDNFGWSLFEGRQPVHPDGKLGPTPIVPPIVEIPHSEGASVTGGFVYRGERFPELSGMYLFGDWETRRVWGVNVDGDHVTAKTELVEPTVRVVGFAEDNAGELYLLDHDDGTIHELVHNKVDPTRQTFPRRLSESGIFSSVADHRCADGVVEFSINAEMWADHATATRAIGVPELETIKLHKEPVGIAGSMFTRTMDYPPDTVLLKTLALNMIHDDPSSRQYIETQVLHYDGWIWRGYTYRWNDDQTDADLVDASGARRSLLIADPTAPGGQRKQVWQFASRGQCVRCHNPWTEHTLAFNLQQLNRESGIDNATENQIRRFRQIGLLEDVLPVVSDNPYAKAKQHDTADKMPSLADPYDESESVEARGRAYLHVNCAHCHRLNGGGSSHLYLTFDKPVEEMEAVGRRPNHGLFGIQDAQILAVGDPYRSVLYYRMSKLGPGHMPHIGSQIIDQRGLALVHDWIRQLSPRAAEEAKLTRLIELDESAVLLAENIDADEVGWNLSHEIARRNGRDEPNHDDLIEADRQAARDADLRAAQRADQREQLTEELFANPSAAMVVARALLKRELPAPTRDLLLATAASRDDPIISELFRPLLAVEVPSDRLGDSIDVEDILSLEGDLNGGRELLLATKTVQCINCHRIGDQGADLGPNLNHIGKKYDRRRLLESMLNPSQEIDPKFINWQLETRTGQVVSGIIVSRENDVITLKDRQNKEHRFAPDEIEGMYPHRTSIMPDLLLRDFTPQQVADVLAYLGSLGTAEASGAPAR